MMVRLMTHLSKLMRQAQLKPVKFMALLVYLMHSENPFITAFIVALVWFELIKAAQEARRAYCVEDLLHTPR
jgi:hypothetical protein